MMSGQQQQYYLGNYRVFPRDAQRDMRFHELTPSLPLANGSISFLELRESRCKQATNNTETSIFLQAILAQQQ
jgi:hypothetical protein